MELLERIAVLIPLLSIGGSAIAYVVKLYIDRADRRKAELFEMMTKIDEGAALATKLAAIYQLRSFRSDRDFVIRFCESVESHSRGDASAPLQSELRNTAEFLRRSS